jgi:diguanylate cyclase (GGDEF)-like protein/PAS domain S-box-containing protein
MVAMTRTADINRDTKELRSTLDHATLRAVFEQASDGIAVMDESRTIIAMNPALERLIGQSAADIVGQASCRAILACEDEAGCLLCDRPCPGQLALSTAVTTPYQELFLKTKEGHTIPVSASFTPLHMGSDGGRIFLMIIRDITDKHRQELHLRHLALTDGLTGLYNRRSLTTQLREEISRSRRYHHPLSLLFIDLDQFKRYNDDRGHRKGDEVLRTLARLFREQMRATDIVARYGGEEFVVLLPETNNEQACTLAEHLRGAVARQLEEQPPDQYGHHTGLTISIGVATFPADAPDGPALLEQADRALYAAKAAGRNRVECAVPASPTTGEAHPACATRRHLSHRLPREGGSP